MAFREGPYFKPCEQVLIAARADAVVLIVCGGTEGSGYEVAVGDLRKPILNTAQSLPAVLREVADKIEVEVNARIKEGGDQKDSPSGPSYT